MTSGRIRIRRVDVRVTPADAIVCPAVGALDAGALVARGIASWAGSDFAAQRDAVGTLTAGSVFVTGGLGRLQAPWVIHAAPPRWSGGTMHEPRLLAETWTAVVEAAASRGLRTIAAPSLATGIHGYPVEQAAIVTVEALRKALSRHAGVELVSICCGGVTGARDHRAYVGAGGRSPVPSAGAKPDPGGLHRRFEAAVERQINVVRAAHGLAPLAPHPTLTAAALAHSERMRDGGFFAHDDPGDGSACMDRVNRVERHAWQLVAENLALGYRGPRAVVDGWMNSTGHRKNVLFGDAERVGTAVVQSANGPLITQLYGRRL